MAKIMNPPLPILSILGYRTIILGSFGGPGISGGFWVSDGVFGSLQARTARSDPGKPGSRGAASSSEVTGTAKHRSSVPQDETHIYIHTYHVYIYIYHTYIYHIYISYIYIDISMYKTLCVCTYIYM